VRLAHRLAPSIARGEVAIALRNIDGADETYAPGTSSWGSRIFGSLNVEF
jgi:hypothetical protein